MSALADTLGTTAGASWMFHASDDSHWPLDSVRVSAHARSMWVVAEHLSRHGGRVNQAELGRALISQSTHGRALDAGPAGPAPARVRYTRSWTGTSAAGRGLLSRSAVISTVPVGLVPQIELAMVAHRARQASAITRADLPALEVAAAQAVAVAVAARVRPIDAGAMIAQISPLVRTAGLHTALQRVPPMTRIAASPPQVAVGLAAHPRAIRTLSSALTAFLLHPDDPLAAIRFATRAGGDARTAATMTGALCGAYHGERALPQPIQVPPQLLRTADALAGLRAGE